MSKKRQQKTLSSLADSQRVALPGTVEYDEMRNRERGEGNMTFVYNENKVPLTSSQNASIFTSSTRLSLESFQVSEELFAMKQLMEKTKPFKKLRQSTATQKLSLPSPSMYKRPYTSITKSTRKTMNLAIRSKSAKPNSKPRKKYEKKLSASSSSLWNTQRVPNNHSYARPEALNVNSADEVIKCILCSQEVKRRQRKYHEEFLCPERLMQCRNPGCIKKIPFSKLAEHEKKLCKFAKLQLKLIKNGKNDGGQARIVSCPLKCGAAIRRNDLGRHQTLVCPNRLVSCPYAPACNKQLQFKLLEDHVKVCKYGLRQKSMAESSRQRRQVPVKCSPHHKFGCGKLLLLKDMARHEKYECPNRLVQCRNVGCKEMIRMNVRKIHEERFCKVKQARDEMLSWGEEIIDCPFGCGAELTAREVVDHKKEKCPNRIVKCRITGCNQEIYAIYRERHETLWEKLRDPSTGADYYYNAVTQETSWEPEGCPLLRKRHKYLKRYEEHAKVVKCPLNCGGEYQDTLTGLRQHQKVCGRFPVPCPVMGCNARVLREEVQLHLDEWCKVMKRRDKDAKAAISKRGMQECPQCQIMLPKQDLKNHMKSWCAEKAFKCPKAGCNAFITYKTSVKHALTECQYWKNWDERIKAARKKQKNPLVMS
eukprot:g11540.t1